MLDLVDLLLLRRGIPADDGTLAFRRIDGNPTSKVLYFLPWNTPFAIARHAGFTPLDFLACYEMPPAIVGADPSLCVQAMRALVADAEQLIAEKALTGDEILIVGLSAGTYPATYLANRMHARLCSVASADRADLAIWQSPATRLVRHRAARKGFGLADYSDALLGTHPAQNLWGIAPDSLFVIGRHDPFVPAPRLAGLLTAVERNVRRGQVIQLSAGHFKTLVMSGAYQRALFGLQWARKTWLVRWPFNASTNRSTFSSPTSRSTAS